MTNLKYNINIVYIEAVYEGILAVDLPNRMKAGETLKLEGRSEFEFSESVTHRTVARYADISAGIAAVEVPRTEVR